MRVIFDKLGLDNRVEPALWYEVRRREMMHEARAEISTTVPKGRQVASPRTSPEIYSTVLFFTMQLLR
jgi:hypothetical protein